MQQMMIDVTGQSFADYMQTLFYDHSECHPVRLLSRYPNHWQTALQLASPMHRGVRSKGGGHIKPELAAGGLWTTAGDLARFLLAIQRSLAGTSNPVISQSMTRQMLTKQKEDSGLGFFLGGDDPPRFGHNGSNPGFNAVTLAEYDTGEGAVFLMNANTDIETLRTS